jgi:hypothetical protein
MIWDNSSTSLQFCHVMSSDGSKALYNFQNTGSRAELHLLDLVTGEKSLLLQLGAGNDLLSFPALSPDGTMARWGSGGYKTTRLIIATGDLRDTFSVRFPEADSNFSLTDITSDNRYFFAASYPASAYIHRIDMDPVTTSPAPDITSISFGRPQLIYGDTTPATVTVQVSDPKGLDNIQSVQMKAMVNGREAPFGEIYEPLVYLNPLTNSGGGLFSGTVQPNIWFSYNSTYPLPMEVGVRIVVRSKDEHYTMADTSITVLPLVVLNPVTTPTNLSSQSIGGTVAPGSTVTVSLNGGAANPATVSGSSWSYTITGLAWGDNVVTVTATDTQAHTKVTTATITRMPKLTVTITGGVGGSVVSDTGGINCPTGLCSAFLPLNTPVHLSAFPYANYKFGSWSGNGMNGALNQRNITMDGDKGVTATFTYVHPSRIYESEVGYPFIHDAYAIIAYGCTIQAREYEFVEDLTLNRSIPVILKGGYDINYLTNSGYSTVDGTVTVRYGSLTLERIIVK